MRVLFWFRKDLRLRDNLALKKSIEGATELISVYAISKPSRPCGVNRWQFLLESLADLDEQLKAVGSRLIVVHGYPIDEIPKLVKKWEIDRIGMEIMHEPHVIKRDKIVLNQIKDCEVIREKGQLLFDPKDIPKVHSYQQFLSKVSGKNVPKPVDIDSVPPLPKNIDFTNFKWPKLSEFHSDQPTTSIKGGSKVAHRMLTEYCSDVDRVAKFEKPETSPGAFDPPATTQLSAHVLWGCLSCREFYHEVKEARDKSKVKSKSKPPVSLEGQLIWREFFHFQGMIISNFDHMRGNAMCRQIPWKSAQNPGDEGYEELQKWKNGETGFPWIDALMLQLKQTGWMHHLGRHSVACFLTRGDLFIHWERGKEHFQEYLVDHDWSLNAGNWLWLSASAFFHQYFRVYGPASFPKKYDKTGALVRHFIPALRKLPDKYIYEPWLMSKSEQKLYNCVLGQDYPHPIGDHKKMSQDCLTKMKKAYMKRKADESWE